MTTIDHALIRRRFVEHPDAARTPREILAEVVGETYPLLDRHRVDEVVDRLFAELMGLGPLERFLLDDEVSDVLVNGPGPVWVERAGRLSPTEVMVSADEIAALVERVFAERGLSVDRSHPIGDTRLHDGSRISVVVEPLVLGGTHVAVRRFAARPHDLAAFAGPEEVALLAGLIEQRSNIVVFGPTGSGKTSLVNALCATIDPTERVVTIEDAAELRLGLPHVVALECRPDNGDGAGGVTMRQLVRAALRLRPDRFVVGEVRGPEALDMVWALASGHDGSLSTCHASTAAEALARIETFVLLADATLPLAAVRAQVRAAVDVLVGVRRVGERREVCSVHRVDDLAGEPSAVSCVFEVGAPT